MSRFFVAAREGLSLFCKGAFATIPPLVLINDYVGTLKIVRGRSMAPLLNPDRDAWFSDVVLVVRDSEPRVGDVVVTNDPRESGPWDKKIVKRIAKIGGDGRGGAGGSSGFRAESCPTPSSDAGVGCDVAVDEDIRYGMGIVDAAAARQDPPPHAETGTLDDWPPALPSRRRPGAQLLRDGVLIPEVGLGRAWLLGDNPATSTDSRKFGAVPIGLIQGIIVGIVWPPSRMRYLLDENGDTVRC